ncbi:hypothetical protein E5343_11165 [Rodentibacter caecimuris]|uniref:hypothetical protein n=3 Tax=Rodentibacter caecimuris TaxID=1796644 RepID=UPI0010944E4A|nr:hypothetical protein [Pasteurella caecimuris]TGY47870.1 hypothetical protein E5343_11165 [Pasteurella caecimuris]
MNKKNIYHDLGYSIRTINKDEIEVKLSFLDGFLRGLFRLAIILIIICISINDIVHSKLPFSMIHEAIRQDFIWAFSPDDIVKPLYEKYLNNLENKDFIAYFPNEKWISYEQYKSSYIDRHFGDIVSAYFHFIWITFVILLFFYPHHRTLRLNRKYRVLYSQNIVGTAVVTVPEKGDPLSGILYNRFSIYPFGRGQHFSLSVTLKLFEGKARDGFFLGIYPTPNAEHNEHIVRAMREFFTQDNPEFLQHIGRCYRPPWCRPLIAFCNSLSPIYFPFFHRKKAEKAIAEYQAEWNKLSPKQQQARYHAVQKRQQEINDTLKQQGFYNEVDHRWTWRDD